MVVSVLVITSGGSYRMVVAGITALGLCMAPIFPTVFALTGEPVPMTRRMTSAFVVSGGGGATRLHWLIGVVVGWFGAAAIMCAIVFIGATYQASHRLSQQLVSSSQIKVRSYA